MVQEKYDTWRLPCSFSRNRIATGSSVALLHLSSADRSYGGDASAIFLDCCHPWPSSTKELRAHLLFFVSGARSLFWWLATGTECATLLHGDSAAARYFLLDRDLSGLVVLALVAGALASRVRANPRTVSLGHAEAIVVGVGLSSSRVIGFKALWRTAIAQRV